MQTQHNQTAIRLLTLSMALFAIEDMFIKLASTQLNIGQLILSIAVFYFVFYFGVARFKRVDIQWRRMADKPVLIRNFGDGVASVGFVGAFSYGQITQATAILQAAPLLTTLGAVLFLGDSVGPRRWLAILLGLFGVLLIVQPWGSAFDPISLLAVVGVFGIALRDMISRSVDVNVNSYTVTISMTLFSVPLSLGVMLLLGGWQWPDGNTWLFLVLAASVGAVANYLILSAFRLGETAVVAPFRYSRMVFVLLIGYFVFKEIPSLWMLVGSAVVIGTGWYTFHRERITRGV
ncbi:MAG: DMT family transporter [Gammaproteobacteria bacterium]|nr:DMT family transporter [Gammaproteobacteria bacterium]